MSRLPQLGRGSRKLVFSRYYATEAYVLTPRYAPRRSGQCYRCHPHHCLPVSRPLPPALPPASAAAGPPPCRRCCRAFFVAQPLLPVTAAADPSVADLQAHLLPPAANHRLLLLPERTACCRPCCPALPPDAAADAAAPLPLLAGAVDAHWCRCRLSLVQTLPMLPCASVAASVAAADGADGAAAVCPVAAAAAAAATAESIACRHSGAAVSWPSGGPTSSTSLYSCHN